MSAHRLSPSAKGDWLVLLGPYNQALIDMLKDVVPPHARQWRPVAKCWRIRPEHRETVQRIIDSFPRHKNT